MTKHHTLFFDRLRHRFRLVLFDDTTLAEVTHARLSRLNLYGWLSAVVLLLLLLLFVLIITTPLKEYVPGYGNFGNYRRALALQRSTDSLSSVAQTQHQYLEHLRSIFTDTLDMPIPTEALSPLTEWADSGANTDIIPIFDTLSTAELDLRREIEQQGNYILASDEQTAYSSGIADLYFFAPATGYIVQTYDPVKGQFGIDIAGSDNAPIKTISDGVILLTDYSPENGFTIVIQHPHDLVSVYKHNSAILKKMGTFVHTGEVIAQMGSSATQLDSGTHLHFELWHRQNPVNPADYIILNH